MSSVYALSTRKWTLQITALTHTPAAATPTRLTSSSVTAAALKKAAGDGDGLTGTAALNDGDTAARAARRTAIDVKA